MKKLIAFLLALVCLFGVAVGESPATPTDLEEEYYEFEDDDWGEVDIPIERKVFLDVGKQAEYLGDTITLVAILVDFLPEDKASFQWQYAQQMTQDWIFIDDAHEQTYTFILDETNMNYWYRVIVEVGE